MVCLLLVVVLTRCNPVQEKWDLRGSWYHIDYGRGGNFDRSRYYSELHVGDSQIQVMEETPGMLPLQAYFIREDSVYKCFWTGPDCEFIPMYKIKKMSADTVWFSVNPKWSKRPETFWVRLARGEHGYYDHVWTKENRDSLETAVYVDFTRRTWKYFMTPGAYDSAVRAGWWKWTMKDFQ